MTCSAYPAITRGNGAASCADAPPPPVIDVVALSRGLPDGVYYAGRQLTEWMSGEQHREIRDLCWRGSLPPVARDLLRTLCAKRAGQSVVVRWRIVNGEPSTSEILVNRLSDGIESAGARAFTWGDTAADEHLLIHALLHETLAGEGSSNDYLDVVAPLFKGLGAEWVLPRLLVAQAIARKDLVDAAARAREVGLDSAAVLAGER